MCLCGLWDSSEGYRCYDPSTGRLYTTMDCDFLETEFFYSTQLSGQGETMAEPLSWISAPSPYWQKTVNPEPDMEQNPSHSEPAQDIPLSVQEVSTPDPTTSTSVAKEVISIIPHEEQVDVREVDDQESVPRIET